MRYTAAALHFRNATLILALTSAAALAIPACSSSGSSAAPAPSATFNPTQQAAVDAIAKAGIINGITAVIVGIDDPAIGHMVKAYGTAGTGGAPLSTDMYYRIASVTKTFTADAVLQLSDAGKLSLHDPISKYVAGVPNGGAITVGDLLAMRSGVYDFTNDAVFAAKYEANPSLPGWTPADTVALIDQHAAQFTAPNIQTVYSNSNYILLGYVIEKASGESAEQYIGSLIAQLGLNGTSFPSRVDLPSPFVSGYLGSAAGPPTAALRDVTQSNPEVPWMAGSIVSTVPDMLKYATELGTGFGLLPQTFALRQSWSPLTTTGPKLQYGLGLTQLGEWIGHDGSIFGYSDLVFYLPARQSSVVVMVNEADGSAVPAQSVWGKIVNQLYPGTITYWP